MRKTTTLAFLLGTMTATACGDDGGTAIDTEGTGGPTTSTTASSTMTTTLTTGVDTSATTGVDTSDTNMDTGCMGECQTADDCAAGQDCISCICVGEPECEWAPGAYGNCVEEGNAACMSPSGGCVVDDPMDASAGVCFFSGCTDRCDCPQPPAGFEDAVKCMNITAGDMEPDCYIDCSGGAACPDGMFCFMGTLCFWGEEPAGIPPYGDCVNQMGTCEGGLCLVDDTMNPTEGACAPNCTMDSDCPAPDTGDSVPVCTDFGMNTTLCELPCDNGETCPDGMECGSFGNCVWTIPEEPGYGDCGNNGAAICRPDEDCLESTMNQTNWGVCSVPGCANETECPDAPDTGDAPVTCGDLGNGNVCYLDCSGNQTCPDNMTCTPEGNCAFEGPGFLLTEDFESGMIQNGWTVVDVDMLVQDMNSVVTVDDAWVVADDQTGSGNLAAVSTSWYNPVGMSDDWLISPVITLGASSVLTWKAYSIDANQFAESYEVRISTGGDTPADFLANAALLTVDPEAQTYTFHSIDLAAEGYMNQDVRIAFRNITDDGYLAFVDDITILQ